MLMGLLLAAALGFPWTLWAGGVDRDQPGGILSEPGIKVETRMGACGNGEIQVVVWFIERTNGETWVLVGSFEPPRWVAYKGDISLGYMEAVFVGSHDGDRLSVEAGPVPYNSTQHNNYCNLLKGGSA